jgi:hypothetical protein
MNAYNMVIWFDFVSPPCHPKRAVFLSNLFRCVRVRLGLRLGSGLRLELRLGLGLGLGLVGFRVSKEVSI